jgi:hypothetical protein
VWPVSCLAKALDPFTPSRTLAFDYIIWIVVVLFWRIGLVSLQEPRIQTGASGDALITSFFEIVRFIPRRGIVIRPGNV